MENQKTVLLLDDEPDIIEVIRVRLEAAGYKVVAAPNGKEGLALLTRESPDIIITDVLMPEMDGFAFYKELKKSPITANIPVLILTARGKMEDSFLVMGVDAFFTKPFSGQALLGKVNELTNVSPKSPAITQEKEKVLVAGSDTDATRDMALQLKTDGYIVDFVTSGSDVVSHVVTFKPAIVVMEVQMYHMEAHDVIKVLRQLDETEKVPIVIYSFYRVDELGSEDVRQKALAVDGAVSDCMEAGATEYIGRYNEHTFVKSINKHSK